MKSLPFFPGAFALAALAFTSLSPASRAHAQEAEKAQVRAALEPGKTLTYDLTLDAMASQNGVDNHVVQSARVRFEVKEVDQAGGAEVVGTLDRLTGVWRDADGQAEFSWTRADDPGIERAASADQEFEAICRAVAGSTIRLRVDSEGQITGVSGLDAASEAAASSKRFGFAGMALFAPAQLAHALAPIWRADGLAGQRSAGSGWQTTREVPIGPAGQIDFVTEWVVTGVADGAVTYVGDESATLMRPSAPDSAAPSATITAHEGRTEGSWSVKAGALQKRTQTRAMATEWKLGDVTIRQDQRIKQTAALAP